MPSGSLVQLTTTAGSISDINYMLVGDPQISFFKSVYMRYSNFSINTVALAFYNGATFGKIARCLLTPCTNDDNNNDECGDLISKITLNIKLSSLNISTKKKKKSHINCACKDCLTERYENKINYGWVNSLGHAIINSCWIEIGGKKIDKQYGEWMEIWSELTIPNEKKNAFYQMIGKVNNISHTMNTFPNEMDLYIPLNFWFCKNVGLALPIMCLYNQEVELVVDFRKLGECLIMSDNKKNIIKIIKPTFNAKILIDYIYLENEERKKLYNESQTYLIEEIQREHVTNINSNSSIVPLYFKNPVKEIIWIVQKESALKKSRLFDFSGNQNSDSFNTASLKINKNYVFDKMSAQYFRLVKSFYHHTRNPTKYIYTYPFCLKPETYQPNGYLNFSNINNVNLILNHDNLINNNNLVNENIAIKVYAVSYNFISISGGFLYKLF
jgi:hypothetical protein